MKIALIGAGRVATHLGKALREAGHKVVQVYSRTLTSAEPLAAELGAEAITDLSRLTCEAEVYLFSVKDSVLQQLIREAAPGREDAVFLHTAGSMSLTTFEGIVRHYGVFYPMQTFSKEQEVCFREIPCFLEANDDKATTILETLAASISDRRYHLSSADRRYLHLAAVWACNFVNHCYDIASEVLESHGIPFDVMLPLIDETARKVHHLTPRQAQTGPAVRYDENVIGAQKQLLAADPLLQELYERLSLSIHNKSEQ